MRLIFSNRGAVISKAIPLSVWLGRTKPHLASTRVGRLRDNTAHGAKAHWPAMSAAVLTAVAVASASELEEPERLVEVIVRAEASAAVRQGVVGSVATVRGAAIALTRPSHPNELLVRVPGVWVTRGSGQEHLTAMRSGVRAGAGACGEFLFLENGIAIRPAGFCNINNLFELNIEQAVAVEAVRGPASALFGGNALHGVINTVTATSARGWRGGVEAGPYDYMQLRLGAGGDRWRFDALSTSTSGYRDHTGYGQQKASFGTRATVGGWQVATTATATLLNQETGGYILGHRAYATPARRGNPNPEAYRDAWSARTASVWRRDIGDGRTLSLTPYLRRSGMAFPQHFLPGQPLEKNAQASGGAQLILAGEERWAWQAGAALEAFSAGLSQRQEAPTRGSAFLVATRPPGTQYDYRVGGLTLAAFYNAEIPVAETVALVTSGRVERNTYRYDNRHLDGNTRDDGTACGFGGCLYTRPADRDDAFTNVAGRLGVAWSRSPRARFYLTAGQGFRPPQITELYRLQRGQTVADLDSERLLSLEAGARGSSKRFDYDVALYAETTAHLIFRDARGFNVSDGKTKSTGVEAAVAWHRGGHLLDFAATYAEHRYAFTRNAGGRERIRDGNAVDTAPRWLGSARWRWKNPRLVSELEVVHVGAHYINAANTNRYDGHTLLHWRGSWQVRPRLRIFGRLVNALNTAYADRADFAFGNYRYFPGMPRQVYVGVDVAGGALEGALGE